MGLFQSCCGGSTSETELIQPDIETKRRQQAEAAERRAREQEGRGIKHPEILQQKQQRLEALERREEEAIKRGDGGAALKWNVG